MVSISGNTSSIGLVRGIAEARQDLLDLQRQLGSGRRSETYGGLAQGGTTSIALRSRVTQVNAFQATIESVQLRLSLVQPALQRMAEIHQDNLSQIRADNLDVGPVDQTTSQVIARGEFDELVNLLRTEVDGRYLFAGRETDTPPVETASVILDGDGTRAGLNQLISERRQADLGADGRGRLTIGPAAGASLTIAEDGAHPFGFKIAAASSTVTGVTVTNTAGPPDSTQIDFAGLPNAGESVTLTLDLPDGTQTTVTLTASVDGAGDSEFAIGANPAATIANLEAAAIGAIEHEASTKLHAASAVATADDFFDAAGNPPQRVTGPPFNTATVLAAGSATDTVVWYTGEVGGDPRNSVAARVDDSITVGYGVRANEDAFRVTLKSLAVYGAETFDRTDPVQLERQRQLQSRVVGDLTVNPGEQSIQSIQAKLVSTESTLARAKERHVQTAGLAQAAVDRIESIDQNEVAISVLALQTRLQAAYETTSIISQLRLVNFL